MTVLRSLAIAAALIVSASSAFAGEGESDDSTLVVEQKSSPEIERLVAALASEDVQTRRDAAYDFAKLGKDALPAIDALVKGLDDRDDQVWMQSAMAVARIGANAGAAIDSLIGSLGDDNDQRRYRSAWALSRIGAEAIPALIEAAGGESTRRRVAALDAMGWMADNPDGIIAALEAALRDDRPDVRRQAAVSMGRLGAPAAQSLGLALNNDFAEVRAAAASALAKLDGHADAYRERLIQLIEDPDSEVRAAAIVAVSVTSVTDRQMVDLIVDAVMDQEADVRAGGVIALKNLTRASGPNGVAEQAVSKLITSLETDDPHQRDSAAFAIGTMGQRGQSAIPALIAALQRTDTGQPGSVSQTGDAEVERDASAIEDALRRIGPASVPALLQAASNDQNASDAAAAGDRLAKALARIGPAATKPLVDALDDEAGVTRTIAARAIGQMRLPVKEAIPALAVCLDAKNAELRAVATTALGRYVQLDETLVDRIHSLCHDPDPRVRAAAVLCVAKTDSKTGRVTGVLLGAFADTDALVRRSAIGGMMHLKLETTESISALIVALDDSDATVRADAAGAIALIGPPADQAVARLTQLLGDPNAAVRTAATSALGATGNQSPEVVSAIGASLSDPDDSVTIASLVALTSMGEQAAGQVETVIGLLNHPRPDLRAAALSCLSKIETNRERSVILLTEALSDGDWSVRRDAANALGELGSDGKGAVPVLLRMLAVPDDTNFAKDALRSINAAGPEAVPILLEGLESEDRRQQYYSLYMLGKVTPKPTDALPTLKRLLEETDSGRLRGAYQRAIDEIQ